MKITLKNEVLTVEIEDRGAQLCSVKNRAGQEYIWQADPAVWGRHAPLLFPVIGRLKEGWYTLNGETYRIPSHGFARDSVFAVEQPASDRAVFTLTHSPETLAVWPFPFVLTVTYTLEGEKLIKTCAVRNPGEKTMYFELGGHDGFIAPHDPGQTMDDCAILLSGCEESITPYGMDEACMITPKGEAIPLKEGRVPLKPAVYGLDTVILDVEGEGRAVLVDAGGKALVTMDYPGFPYLGIWTATPGYDANYVCIEPWSTLPDATFVGRDLTEKAGICSLEGGRTRELTYTTTFHS